MRLWSVALVMGFYVFGCGQSFSAEPVYPTAIERAAVANSALQEAVYTYRRTKHGFEKFTTATASGLEVGGAVPQDTRLLS